MTDSYVDYMKRQRGLSKHGTDSEHDVAVEPRYVKLSTSNQQRWLKATLRSEKNIALCEYTRVTMIKSEDGKTYFKIADGTSDFVGSTAYVADENVKFLTATPPTTSADTLRVKYGPRSKAVSAPRGNELLDQQWATMAIPGQSTPVTVTLNSKWDGKFTPIPPGKHRIMAPDAPHDASYTAFYVDYAKKTGLGEIIADRVWFPIELEGTSGNSSRYVHIGNLSEGCVTVYALNRWNDVYNFLISRRLPDTRGKYLAYLEVTR